MEHWNNSQIFNYTHITNKDLKPSGSHYMAKKITQISDFLVDKYKTLLLPPIIFWRFSQKKVYGLLFIKDGRVITNILLFSAFLKCAKVELHLSSWQLKCCYIQKNSPGTDRENMLPGNLCIIKMNVRHQRKAIFSMKKYLPIQSMTSSCSKNSQHPWRSHFNIEFSGPSNFSGKLLLKSYPISLPTIKRMVYFKSKLTLSKTIEYLLMSLVTHSTF